MTTERNRHRIPWPSALLLAAAVVMALSPAALAGPNLTASAKTHGTCSGSSRWVLKVQFSTGAPLVVRYSLSGAAAGEKWNVFISDNGNGVYAGSRTTNSAGAFVVDRSLKNLRGADTIKVAANTSATGETCGARAAI